MKPKIVDIGTRFGRLVVVGNAPKAEKSRNSQYTCKCDCGQTKIVTGSNLRQGKVSSCGCYLRESRFGRQPALTHGQAGNGRTPTYRSWMAMHDRCRRSGHPAYAQYGGRGIRVCDRWQSFEAFLEDMGERPEGTTLDRIENDGNYEPGNCRWATSAAQANNRRTNVFLTYRGRTLSIGEWAKEIGVKPNALRMRLRKKWPLERALSC